MWCSSCLGCDNIKIHIHPLVVLQILCLAGHLIYTGGNSHSSGYRHKEDIARMGIGCTHIPHASWRHTKRKRIPLTIDLDVLTAPLHPTLGITGKISSLVGIETAFKELLIRSYHLIAHTRVEYVATVYIVVRAIAYGMLQMVAQHRHAHITQILVRDTQEKIISQFTFLARNS